MTPTVVAAITGTDLVLALCALLLTWVASRWVEGTYFHRPSERPAPAGPSGIPQAIVDHHLLKLRSQEVEMAGKEAPLEAPALRRVA